MKLLHAKQEDYIQIGHFLIEYEEKANLLLLNAFRKIANVHHDCRKLTTG